MSKLIVSETEAEKLVRRLKYFREKISVYAGNHTWDLSVCSQVLYPYATTTAKQSWMFQTF